MFIQLKTVEEFNKYRIDLLFLCNELIKSLQKRGSDKTAAEIFNYIVENYLDPKFILAVNMENEKINAFAIAKIETSKFRKKVCHIWEGYKQPYVNGKAIGECFDFIEKWAKENHNCHIIKLESARNPDAFEKRLRQFGFKKKHFTMYFEKSLEENHV